MLYDDGHLFRITRAYARGDGHAVATSLECDVEMVVAEQALLRGFDEDLADEQEQLRNFLRSHMSPHPHLYGRTTLFSTMSDWNPAEMIGVTPRPLALSLYQKLIYPCFPCFVYPIQIDTLLAFEL